MPLCMLPQELHDGSDSASEEEGPAGGGGWWCPGEVAEGSLTASGNSRSCDWQHMMWWGLTPWLSHPTVTDTSSATPLSGTHQTVKADLSYWSEKMIKGLTSRKVGDSDLWADFSKRSPCAAHTEIIQGTLGKVVASWIPETTELAFLKVGGSKIFTLN